MGFLLEKYVAVQREWSLKVFGPYARTAGIVDHIHKELKEIEQAPHDLKEWVDVVILALDGAWRAGYSENEIVVAMIEKQQENLTRSWPNWRTADPSKAIEHDRTLDQGTGAE